MCARGGLQQAVNFSQIHPAWDLTHRCLSRVADSYVAFTECAPVRPNNTWARTAGPGEWSQLNSNRLIVWGYHLAPLTRLCCECWNACRAHPGSCGTAAVRRGCGGGLRLSLSTAASSRRVGNYASPQVWDFHYLRVSIHLRSPHLRPPRQVQVRGRRHRLGRPRLVLRWAIRLTVTLSLLRHRL